MYREVTFRPQIEDHVAGQRLWFGSYLRRWPIKLLLAGLVLLELVALAGISFHLARGAPLAWTLSDNAVPLIAPFVVVGLGFWNWHRIPGQVRRMVEQQPSLFSETEWRWNDQELTVRSAAGSSRIEWPTLYGWLANEKSIVIRPQERLVLILPRRVLAPDQAADLIATLERFAVRACRA